MGPQNPTYWRQCAGAVETNTLADVMDVKAILFQRIGNTVLPCDKERREQNNKNNPSTARPIPRIKCF